VRRIGTVVPVPADQPCNLPYCACCAGYRREPSAVQAREDALRTDLMLAEGRTVKRGRL
jgi:hypothetical protein